MMWLLGQNYINIHLIKKVFISIFFLLASCTNVQDPWKLDGMETGYAQYNSSRLTYSAPLSHLSLEFLKTGKETASYLFSRQFKFIPTSSDSKKTEVTLTIGEKIIFESLPLREGRMRLKLSPETTQQIIHSLQQGKQITIVTSGIKETIYPATFEIAFEKLLRGDKPLNFIRGPFE